MVICALWEYNKADHYPRENVKDSQLFVLHVGYNDCKHLKISELTLNYHLKSRPPPLTVKVTPLMCILFEKLVF